jgi:hypothetical protein
VEFLNEAVDAERGDDAAIARQPDGVDALVEDDLLSAAPVPLVSRNVTPELPASPYPRINQQRRLDTRSILTTAMVSPAASRSTAAYRQDVGALPSERRRHPRARNCAALGTHRPHEQPRGGGHGARPVHRGEKLSVRSTDVDKILVEGAKAFRANTGLNEHAFVNGLNAQMAARFAAG